MLALADSAAGKRALCPSCETEFRVPEPQAPLAVDAQRPGTSPPDPLVRCPACERTLAYDPVLAGQAIICPTCGRRLRMPGPGEQVVDLGAAAGQPPGRRPATTATASPFPNFGENPYASRPTPVPLQPRPSERMPLYSAAGAILMIFSSAGLFFGGLYLLLLMFGGAFMASPIEFLIALLVMMLAGLSHALTIAGGLQMILRRNLLLARIGAWAALYPCGMCSILQVPFAIWALVLLYRSSARPTLAQRWAADRHRCSSPTTGCRSCAWAFLASPPWTWLAWAAALTSQLVWQLYSRVNMSKHKTAVPLEVVEPIGPRVLVRKDEPKRETKGGIALPDASEIPTITGRIVTISAAIEHDEDVPLRQYDKILFHPKNAIPVDLEHDNQLFVVPIEDVVAVFRRPAPE